MQITATARRGIYRAEVGVKGAHAYEVVEVASTSMAGTVIHSAHFPSADLGRAARSVVKLVDYTETMLASVTR